MEIAKSKPKVDESKKKDNTGSEAPADWGFME
jgi:hypothetical protein